MQASRQEHVFSSQGKTAVHCQPTSSSRASLGQYGPLHSWPRCSKEPRAKWLVRHDRRISQWDTSRLGKVYRTCRSGWRTSSVGRSPRGVRFSEAELQTQVQVVVPTRSLRGVEFPSVTSPQLIKLSPEVRSQFCF